MIERLNGRAAVGIAAGGLLLVLLVGWFGVVSPQRSKAAELSIRIGDTEDQLAVTQALVRGPLLRLSTAQLATLRTAIPDELKMSQVLRQLSKASTDARVRILGITPQPAVAAGGAEVVGMSVAIEGRYFAIRDFLRLLRTRADIKSEKVRASGRLFAIDSIQFTGASAETGGGLIQATMTVAVFAYNGAAPPPVAGADGTSVGVAVVDPGLEAARP